MHPLIRTAVVSLAVWTVTACAGIDIDQAKKLSSAGVASSTTLQTEARTTVSRAMAWRDARVFENVLVNGRVEKAGQPDFAAVDQQLDTLAKLLTKRSDALAGLVNTYKSFKELTDYGAADATEKVAAGFFASTNDFLAAVQALPAGTGGDIAKGIPSISPQASEGLSIAFGLIAAEVQKAQIKKASVALRTGVETLAGALKAEQQYAIATREFLGGQWKTFRNTARQAGLVDYEPTVRELLAQYDLEPVKDLAAAIRRMPSAAMAVEELQKARDKASLGAIDEKYTSLLRLLDDLIRQHKALEAGRAVSVGDILAAVQQIAGYYERVRDAGKKSDTTK